MVFLVLILQYALMDLQVLPESLKAFLRSSIFMTLMMIFFNGEDGFEKFLPLCCICTSYNIDNYDIIFSLVRKKDGHIKAITILKIWINWPLNGLVGKSSKIYLTIYISWKTFNTINWPRVVNILPKLDTDVLVIHSATWNAILTIMIQLASARIVIFLRNRKKKTINRKLETWFV